MVLSHATKYSEGFRKVVIIGIDFDARSRDAFVWAMRNVITPTDHVVLLHATPEDIQASMIPMGSALPRPEIRAVHRLMKMYISYCETAELSHEVRHSLGEPEIVLKTTVEELEPDLVVLGNHNKGVLSRVVFGTLSEYAAHNLAVPVVVVRTSQDIEVTGPALNRRLGVAINNSLAAASAFQWTIGTLYREQDEVVLMHIFTREEGDKISPQQPRGVEEEEQQQQQEESIGVGEESKVDEKKNNNTGTPAGEQPGGGGS